MEVGVKTLGCKVNQYESESLQEELLSYGFDLVDPESETPDFFILNSCSVTVSAQAKGRKLARRFRRKNEDSTIVFTGCYAELSGDELEEELPEVDYIVGNSDKDGIPELLLREAGPTDMPEGQGESHVAFRSRKFLKIQDGCRDWCTFCIVPHTRPELESMKPEDVIHQIRQLNEENGYGEIVLSGVHLGDYGIDLDRDYRLTDLVRDLAEEPLDCRVRFSSVEPQDVTREMIDIIAGSDRFCNHLHLPIQSGSTPILERMQRNYDREYLYDLAEYCRQKDPDFALNTDLIAGFPGETEEDHERTKQLARDICFSRMHVFRYSERPGTAGEKMDDQVHSKVRKRRTKELIELGDELETRWARRFEGQTDSVLVEDREVDGSPIGYTQYYLPARIDGSPAPNETVSVTLGSFEGDYFEADLIESNE
ncbi:MAG: tRNA (N(6)-L-threonylcarbamoyladenosine(37)-C(2))-methylthiotransferase MtaB [bacterium]